MHVFPCINNSGVHIIFYTIYKGGKAAKNFSVLFFPFLSDYNNSFRVFNRRMVVGLPYNNLRNKRSIHINIFYIYYNKNSKNIIYNPEY